MHEVPRILGGPRTLYDGNVAANTKGGHTDIALPAPSKGAGLPPPGPYFANHADTYSLVRKPNTLLRDMVASRSRAAITNATL